MQCPVCGKEAKIPVYYCARCLVHVHAACWQKHIMNDHKSEETKRGQENMKRKDKSLRQLAITKREVAIAKREVGLTKRQLAVTEAESPKDRKGESTENKLAKS